MYWVRLVHFCISEAHVFKAKMFTSGLSLFYSPFETCFLEVKARYIYVIAFKKKTTKKQPILETAILTSLIHSIQP